MAEKQEANAHGPGRAEAEKAAAGKDVPVEQKVHSPPGHWAMRRRTLVGVVVAALVLAGLAVFGIPWLILTFSTVSTDDAFVNGHVTFVAPRIGGQLLRVLVDDNARVRKGDLLAQIDKDPFVIAVSQKQATVEAFGCGDTQPLIPNLI